MEAKFKGKYGKSKQGNFTVIDTMGVPHTYYITPKHLSVNEGMYLDIEAAEEKGAVCDICKKRNRKLGDKILTYKEHETALLLSCKIEIKDNKELHTYLLKIKDIATKNNYVGFAFIKYKDIKENSDD